MMLHRFKRPPNQLLRNWLLNTEVMMTKAGVKPMGSGCYQPWYARFRAQYLDEGETAGCKNIQVEIKNEHDKVPWNGSLGLKRQWQEVDAQLSAQLTAIQELQLLLPKEGDQDWLEMVQQELSTEYNHLNGLLGELYDILHELVQPELSDTQLSVNSNQMDYLMEIRPAVGGEEAMLFAGELANFYLTHLSSTSCIHTTPDTPSLQPSSSSSASLALTLLPLKAYRECLLLVRGYPWSWLKFEAGVHRVQRIPSTETEGRLHTSTVTVSVLPFLTVHQPRYRLESSEFRVDVKRASGPGGQHVNKTESAVRITHLPTGLWTQCQQHRNQHQNKEQAFRILTSKLVQRDQETRQHQESSHRKQQMGTGQRSEKIRTFHFPQNRLTDHRLKTSQSLSSVWHMKPRPDPLESVSINDAQQEQETSSILHQWMCRLHLQECRVLLNR